MKFEIDTFVQTVWFFRTSLNEKKAIPFTSRPIGAKGWN